MPLREATPDEIKQVEGGQLREATPEEARTLGLPEEEKPGFVTRIIQRALGTDVDDPMELERLGAVMAGAIGGSMIGARTPVAPGPAGLLVNPLTGTAVGGLIGVAAGSVFPEATLEAMEFLGVIDPGARDERGLSEEDLKKVVAGEALLEVATLGAASGIRLGGRFVGQKLTGLTKADMAFAREASNAGIDMAPFQLGARGLGRGIINTLGRFTFLGSKARRVSEAADEVFRGMMEGVPERVAPILGAHEVGQHLWRDARHTVVHASEQLSREYDDLFLRAREAGVSYRMSNTNEAASGVLQTIERRRPNELVEVPIRGQESVFAEVPTEAAEAAEIAKKFINRGGYDRLGTQSLDQADELLLKLDQRINKIKNKKIRAEVEKLLAPISGAVKTDVNTNGLGEAAGRIGQELTELDTRYSNTWAYLLETSAAERFTTVQKGGLRTRVAPSQRQTRVPVDKLMQTVLDLDSPQVMDELSRLVPPETFAEMTSLKLGELFQNSMVEVKSGATKFLGAGQLGRNLGVTGGRANATRRAAVSTMLERSGSPLTMDDLGVIVKAAQKISDTPIPNWSTFLARRATIGGAQSLLRGAVPILALTGGSGAVGVATGSGIIGGLAFFLGSKGLVGAVSNPANARFFHEVLDREAPAIAKRAAFLRITRAGAQSLTELGEISGDVAKQLVEDAEQMVVEIFPEEK